MPDPILKSNIKFVDRGKINNYVKTNFEFVSHLIMVISKYFHTNSKLAKINN